MTIATKKTRALANAPARAGVFLLGLGGPVVTWRLYMAQNTAEGGLEFIISIAVGYLISVIIAGLVHCWIKPFGWAVFAAGLLSLATYGLAMTGAVLYESDPEALMWLPVILLFMGINGVPMAFIVSWATIAAMRTTLFRPGTPDTNIRKTDKAV